MLTQWQAAWRVFRHGWCAHRSLVRAKVDGVWYFTCACGYQVPIVRRTAEELARCRQLTLGGSR